MGGVELLRTRGPEDEQSRSGFEPAQEVEPLDRLAVAPLQVVDEEEQGRRSREHRPGQALEEAQPVAELRHGGGPRQAGPGGEQLGQDPRDLDPPHVLEPGEARREGVAAQPFADRGEGEPAFRGVGARLRGSHSLALGPGSGAPRPAATCRCRRRRSRARRGPAQDGPLPDLAQPRPLALPAYERRVGGGDLAPPAGPEGPGSASRIRSYVRTVSAVGSAASSRRSASLHWRYAWSAADPIAGQREEAHEPAVRPLVEGVVLQPVPDVGDGARVLALLLEQAHERGHGVLAAPRETFPLRLDPVVVAAREERSLAQVHRPLQAGAAKRRVSRPGGRLGFGDLPVEEVDVEAAGRVGGPLHV